MYDHPRTLPLTATRLFGTNRFQIAKESGYEDIFAVKCERERTKMIAREAGRPPRLVSRVV